MTPRVRLGVAMVAAWGAWGAPAAAAQAVSPDRVSFTASLTPDTIYVGQQATYTITVRVPSEVRQRLRRNPEFVPPEMRGLLAYDLPLAKVADGENDTEVHIFRRAIFALTPGRYPVAPSRLSYLLPQSQSFFSRYEERTLRSTALSFVAIDPPTAGRPATWLGAVGQWSATARLDAPSARVGDPVVLTLRVAGTGNANLLPRPPLTVAWAEVVPTDDRVIVDSTPTLLGGAKEFRWLLTPREDGSRMVPPIVFSYFDPQQRRYVTTESAPLRVTVAPGTLVSLPVQARSATREAPLVVHTTLSGAAWADRVLPWVWLLFVLVPVPATVRLWRLRRLERRATALRPVVRRTPRAEFDAAIRDRTGLPMEQLTAPGALARALRLEGVTAAVAQDAEALRDELDRTVFARSATTNGTHTSSAARVQAVLAKIAAEARGAGVAVLLLVALTLGCGGGPSDTDTMRAFAAGRTAYAGGDFARARDAFAAVVERAPRDVAAWRNLGDAAWQAADTAVAVQAWQRAQRLDPRDGGVRERLRRVRAPQHEGAARVWPVSPLGVALLALALWGVVWVMAYRRAGGQATLPRAVRRSALIAAVLLAGTAAWLDARLAARDIGVVSEARPLLALPALGAEAGAVPLVGEVAQVTERRGVWVHLTLSGERAGWYPSEYLLPVSRP